MDQPEWETSADENIDCSGPSAINPRGAHLDHDGGGHQHQPSPMGLNDPPPLYLPAANCTIP